MTHAALESTSEASSTTNLRVAWLLPAAVLYWQPLLKAFTQQFPQTIVFTSLWRGFIQGYENSFCVEVVGQRKFMQIGSTTAQYKPGFMYLPLSIIQRLLKAKPQIIFSNSFGVWTILALLMKPLGRWKVVIAYEGSSPGVDYRNSPARLLLRKLMVLSADALITNSRAGKSYLTEILRAEEAKVFLNPYEVPDTAAMSKAQDIESSVPQQHPVFVYIGQMIPRKGLNLLLQACAKLKSQGCDRYTLLLIGDGPQQEELEAFSAAHQLQSQITWTGRVSYDRLGAYLRSADVFVFPTLEDTWGMVVLELMALGKPILCSKWAGASDLIAEGENGYIFDPYDLEELAEAMRRFIDEPNLSAAMGVKSAQLMSQYTPESTASFLAEVAAFVWEK